MKSCVINNGQEPGSNCIPYEDFKSELLKRAMVA